MNTLRETTTIDADMIARFVKNPYLQITPEWVPMVWDFWAFFSHLLKAEGELALCTRIRWLRDNDGLTFDELQEAMRDCRKPKASAEFQFPSQVLAGMDAAINGVRNREAEKRKHDIAELEKQGRDVPMDRRVVTNLADAFRNPGGHR